MASLLGHRDPTVALKLHGRHIEKRREHLRELIEAGDQRGLIEKADQPPQPPEPANGQEQAEPVPHQDDGNPLGLKVVGEVPPKPEPKQERQKRDAG